MNVPESDQLLRPAGLVPVGAAGGNQAGGTAAATATAVLAEPPLLPEREPRPAVGTGTVTVIVPARNEAANVGWVLSRMPDCADEVILVDGDSTDATLEMARASLPGVRVVSQRGRGKGSALRTGFMEAKGDYIVMIDADGSMSPREIPRYVHFLENGYDFVKGSRFMGGGGSLDITTVRRLGNRALLTLTNVMYQSTLTDLCYGFIAFHRSVLDRLDLQSTGFEIETEMVVRALLSGLRVAEVPTLELPRRYGQSNLRTFRDGQRVLRTLLREHRGRDAVSPEAAG
jgi:glycosyltransferase involved in cell wall biosynthesis